jgi:hypothetical protein
MEDIGLRFPRRRCRRFTEGGEGEYQSEHYEYGLHIKRLRITHRNATALFNMAYVPSSRVALFSFPGFFVNYVISRAARQRGCRYHESLVTAQSFAPVDVGR